MKVQKIIKLALVASFLLFLSSCCSIFCPPPPPPPRTFLTPTMEGSSQGEIAFLWVAAVKDAYVACRTQGCADGDLNYGTSFHLDVGGPSIPPGTSRIYVEFYMPELPERTEVLEAYINLYENSLNIPGNTVRPVVRVIDEWNPRTITYNNQPVAIGPLSEDARLGKFRAVNEWRGTLLSFGNLVQIVQEHLNNPARNHGFLINDPSNTVFLRSFQSDNAPSRTETDMDFSPRLLFKVKLPYGDESALNAVTVGLPPLPMDTDLDEFLTGPDVLMVRVAGGADWPAIWDVAFD